MLFGNNFGKEQNYKIILDFIVYFDKSTTQYGGVPYHLNNVQY